MWMRKPSKSLAKYIIGFIRFIDYALLVCTITVVLRGGAVEAGGGAAGRLLPKVEPGAWPRPRQARLHLLVQIITIIIK